MHRFILTFALAALTIHPALGQSKVKNLGTKQRPIRALLVCGGCCHDYTRQKQIISKGVSARANVVWTLVQQGGTATDSYIPLYRDKNWSAGYDIVVHNECFSHASEKEWVENIVRPHREGLPAMLIHCAMHSYRTGDDTWFEFVGMQSPGHGPHYSYTVDNVKSDHPAMQGFGKTFIAPKGELYHSIKLFDTATVLGQAKRMSDGEPQTCIWTNKYGKGNVFATTIGHYNETMAEPKWLDMFTKGLLWSVGLDTAQHFTPSTPEIDAQIKTLVSAPAVPKGDPNKLPVECCGGANLAFKRPAKAQSEEANKQNFAKNAVDGDLSTRWCSQGQGIGQTWQVELEKVSHVRSLRIHWEKKDAAYKYKIHASADGKKWVEIVDQSGNNKKAKVTPHRVDSPDTKFLQVTFLGASGNYWGSFWEFEAYATPDLPELPKTVTNNSTSNATIADVQAPAGFNVTLFGNPPEVNYPVCIASAPTGEVFIGVDPQGSLGKEDGQGKVLRCIDVDGDGKADRINEFARMDHPRGLFYDNGSLWVLHPPTLSVFHDTDGDGTADQHEELITGISTDEVERRGADHTTNGIRMGIDGWLYIAVGDFGFTNATGADGRVLAKRGGGILRVRPNGKEMEIYNWGQRNIMDVCIDPLMNVYTRDNTNDGGGWDIRLSHIHQSGNYGYPSLYVNFTEEGLPPLADYGGGSGCGAMYLHDLRWPAPFGDALYTCDWGRSEVYRHNLPSNGVTFDAHQEVFLKIPRPTDMDVDGSGRMVVASWKNGKFSYSGEDVGFVAMLTPNGHVPKPFPIMSEQTDSQLLSHLNASSHIYQIHAQREILRRGRSEQWLTTLTAAAANQESPLYGRVAAIYTLKQLAGNAANPILLRLLKNEAIREHALRAITDREDGLQDLDIRPFTNALADANPRVQAQALICLGRIGNPAAGESIIAHTLRDVNYPKPVGEPLYKQADPGRVLSHLAIRALERCNATEACLNEVEGPYAEGAFWALKYMHNLRAVDGLIKLLSTTQNAATREEAITTLIRLYHHEGEYSGGWWGTRPDLTGPYFDRQTWEQSEKIATVLRTIIPELSSESQAKAGRQLARHKVEIDGLQQLVTDANTRAEMAPIKIARADPNNPDLIANLKTDISAYRANDFKGNPKKGAPLFSRQNCVACHTTANGQIPKGPHLVDIGKRYKKQELIESILNPNAKIAQGFNTYAFITVEGKVITGFITSESATEVNLRQTNGLPIILKKDEIEVRRKSEGSMMPKGLVDNLTPELLADLIAYLQTLKSN
ncbi:MAG: heme-binding domain-containing protein [Planctomycetaceae bacterium]|nr:heme-binding domain-containing protein [Planctomycetaceae bacterium]